MKKTQYFMNTMYLNKKKVMFKKSFQNNVGSIDFLTVSELNGRSLLALKKTHINIMCQNVWISRYKTNIHVIIYSIKFNNPLWLSRRKYEIFVCLFRSGLLRDNFIFYVIFFPEVGIFNRKQEKTLLFLLIISWSPSWSRACFLSFFLNFLFSIINSHLSRFYMDRGKPSLISYLNKSFDMKMNKLRSLAWGIIKEKAGGKDVLKGAKYKCNWEFISSLDQCQLL